jgi:hypothetical protein
MIATPTQLNLNVTTQNRRAKATDNFRDLNKLMNKLAGPVRTHDWVTLEPVKVHWPSVTSYSC